PGDQVSGALDRSRPARRARPRPADRGRVRRPLGARPRRTRHDGVVRGGPVKDQDLPPEARTALVGRLLLDMLAVLPPASSTLYLSRQEIEEREQHGRAIGARLHDLVTGRPEDEA